MDTSFQVSEQLLCSTLYLLTFFVLITVQSFIKQIGDVSFFFKQKLLNMKH